MFWYLNRKWEDLKVAVKSRLNRDLIYMPDGYAKDVYMVNDDLSAFIHFAAMASVPLVDGVRLSIKPMEKFFNYRRFELARKSIYNGDYTLRLYFDDKDRLQFEYQPSHLPTHQFFRSHVYTFEDARRMIQITKRDLGKLLRKIVDEVFDATYQGKSHKTVKKAARRYRIRVTRPLKRASRGTFRMIRSIETRRSGIDRESFDDKKMNARHRAFHDMLDNSNLQIGDFF
ncbi:hypothetical protein [Faecalibaculum rodentium]|uniref:hypothetical protein n=2 Tax=Faecalibaculum rodentium TaxID=1702221 RepID=UPI00248FC9A9|nr:hypothetical protein [Faecalibaculum rodentium]